MTDNIPASMVLNWDQTPINYISSGNWTMERQGQSKVPIAGQADKRSLTAILTVSMAGDFLPMQLIYTGKTARSLPKQKFPDGFDVTQNPSHWSNEETMLQYVEVIIKPYLQKQREVHGDKPAVLIYDAFRAHTMETVQEKLAQLNAKLIMVPKNMTDHLQPLDISVNKPVKGYMKARFNEWYTNEILKLEQAGDNNYEAMGQLLKSGVALRELSAGWITNLYEHFQEPNQREIIINGFKHCNIVQRCLTGPLTEDPFEEWDRVSEILVL